jgi:probable F420-dependent oxidoreductase
MTLTNYVNGDPGSWEYLFEQAKILDRTGIDRLTLADHVAYGENVAAYGRPELGGYPERTHPVGPDGHFLEPLTTLAAISRVTTRVRLCTNVLLAALRRPLVLSKEAATIDVLSGGRLDLGVGIGWQREEYGAAGLVFEQRGKLLDHTLSVCQSVWQNRSANFSDDFLSFDAVHSMPKPLQKGGVPIWVSGTANPKVARRLVRFGTGWVPWGEDMANVEKGIARMRRLVEAEGRQWDGFGVVGMLPPILDSQRCLDIEAMVARASDLVSAGVTDVRTTLRFSGVLETDQEILTRLVQGFRRSVGRP